MIYFTSDLHLGHRGIIEMQNRPFENVEKMNRVLVDNYNEVVNKNDTAYFLGDISHHMPIERVNELLSMMKGKKILIKGKLKIEGILITLADMRTNLARSTESALRENYGKAIHIYKTIIPVGIKAAEASVEGKSVYEHEKRSVVAKAYEAFTKEVIADGERQRIKHENSLSR